MKIVNIRQGTPEWLAWRDRGVSASDIATILGLSPYKSPWRLWAERAGVVAPEDLSGNIFVAHGKRCEPALRRWFEEKHGTMLFPACAESGEIEFLRASFDGLTDDEVPVELKAPSDAVFDEVVALREDSPAYRLYCCQVQAQICVSGKDHGYLVFGRVVEHGAELVVDQAIEFKVPRDDAFIADMVAKASAFLQSVKDRKEPQKDPARDLYAPVSEEDKAAWQKAASEFKAADAAIEARKAEIAKLEADKDAAKKRMLALMGTFAQADSCGIAITRYLQRGTVKYDALLKDKGITVTDTELDGYRGAPSERVKITVQGPEQTDTTGSPAAAAA